MIAIDRDWLARHPLPVHGAGTDKNARGRVLAAGGAVLVPGALRLTAEGALRAGAGKVQMATVASAAMALGVLVPEAAMIALPTDDDGQIAVAAAAVLVEALGRCDAFVLGPGMGDRACAARLVEAVLETCDAAVPIVLDAAAVACAGWCMAALGRHRGRLVLTPHSGEMAELMEVSADEIAARPDAVAQTAADRFDAVIVMKSGATIVAARGAEVLRYEGGGVGLATGGSGDVLAGVIAGLLARGMAPREASAWGVWLHGEAGRALAERSGPIGFLARELPGEVPRLMRDATLVPNR